MNAAEDCLVFCRISPGIYIVHYFAPLSKLLEWEEERQRAIQGVREVVETASDKMSMAPELNPGDWKWIECITHHTASGAAGTAMGREGTWSESTSGTRMKKRSTGEWEKEQWCVTSWPLELYKPPSSPIIPLLRLRILLSLSHAAFFYSAKPAECPTALPPHQHQEMETIGRARLIPGWQEGIGFRRG